MAHHIRTPIVLGPLARAYARRRRLRCRRARSQRRTRADRIDPAVEQGIFGMFQEPYRSVFHAKWYWGLFYGGSCLGRICCMVGRLVWGMDSTVDIVSGVGCDIVVSGLLGERFGRNMQSAMALRLSGLGIVMRGEDGILCGWVVSETKCFRLGLDAL